MSAPLLGLAPVVVSRDGVILAEMGEAVRGLSVVACERIARKVLSREEFRAHRRGPGAGEWTYSRAWLDSRGNGRAEIYVPGAPPLEVFVAAEQRAR